jgi:hypothetical protein
LSSGIALSAVAQKTESGADRAELAGKALIGQRAPNLKLKTIDGMTIDLAKSTAINRST